MIKIFTCQTNSDEKLEDFEKKVNSFLSNNIVYKIEKSDCVVTTGGIGRGFMNCISILIDYDKIEDKNA